MRMYFVNNMYLSSIQNGIQAAHVVHEIFNKYGLHADESPEQLNQLIDWSKNHKTMIVLNGGMTEHLEVTLDVISKSGLLFAEFYEPGIGNALTSIGVIIPEKLYNIKDDYLGQFIMTEHMLYNLDITREEYDMIKLLKTMSLAK